MMKCQLGFPPGQYGLLPPDSDWEGGRSGLSHLPLHSFQSEDSGGRDQNQGSKRGLLALNMFSSAAAVGQGGAVWEGGGRESKPSEALAKSTQPQHLSSRRLHRLEAINSKSDGCFPDSQSAQTGCVWWDVPPA